MYFFTSSAVMPRPVSWISRRPWAASISILISAGAGSTAAFADECQLAELEDVSEALLTSSRRKMSAIPN